MSRTVTRIPTLALLAAALLFPSGSLRAQEEDEARQRWVFKGELTSVISQGNSENLTLGLGSTIRRRWENTELRFEAGAIRVESGTVTRNALGTVDNFTVEKSVNTQKTAEAITARGEFDHYFTETVTLYGGVDWLRNTFAGIDSRTLIAAGVGKSWFDTDTDRFSTRLAATYTFQRDVVENPFLDTDFAGARFLWNYWRKISGNSEFESSFTADLNLQETDDRRIDTTQSLTVDINDTIALKPSIQFLWRDLPSLTEIPLLDTNRNPTGDTVLAELDKLDVFFRLALVLTF
jgi:putative salt-induced outer membrane protein YdiY